MNARTAAIPALLLLPGFFHMALCDSWDAPGDAPGPADGQEERGASGRLFSRERLERAARSLSDAWFIMEQEGRPIGYHRIRARILSSGDLQVQDDMVLASSSGRTAFHSEVTTGPGLTNPGKASCETRRAAAGAKPPGDRVAMKGSVRFLEEEIELSTTIYIDGLGVLLKSPRKLKGTRKRAGGPILFQNLVPLLLTVLPEKEDGSSLGRFTLIEFPADLDRLIAMKPGRAIEVKALSGGSRQVFLRWSGKRDLAATIQFGDRGEITKIEMKNFTERRAGRDEVRQKVPGAFPPE